MTESPAAIRAALFIDFDNIFISLNRFDSRAAKTFAERPTMWLNWLESGRHALLDKSEDEPIPRRVLVRNCYLNPAAFANQRAFFTRAAFTVVDCPALTAQGKNSADIVMAMDMLDAIQHPTCFDEFIILSSDADFTPVLTRLRAHDRLTSVMTNAVTAAAFRESCDFSIDLETFSEEALGLSPEARKPQNGTSPRDGQQAAEAYANVRPEAARLLLEETRRIGPVPAQDIFRVFTRLDAFHDSHWFGMGALKTLLDDLVLLEHGLFVEMDGSVPGVVRLRESDDTQVELPAAAPAPVTPPAKREISDADYSRFVDDVFVLIGAPKLPTPVYQELFKALATVASRGVATPDEFLAIASDPPPRGAGVSRRDASYVIGSLADWGAFSGQPNALTLARRFRDYIRSALANAGHGLDEDGRAYLDGWLLPKEDC
jgi:hypothetical protein